LNLPNIVIRLKGWIQRRPFFEKHRTTGRWIIGGIVFVVLVLIASSIEYLSPEIPLPYGVFSSITIATGVGFLGYRLSDEIFDRWFTKKASFTLDPLDTVLNTELEPSQHFAMSWGPIDKYNFADIYFGVIRVSCLGGDALRCKAEARCFYPHANISPGRSWFVEKWDDCGYLNWYSKSLLHNLPHKLSEFKSHELTLNITKSEESFSDGDVKYLLLCYSPSNWSSTYLCSDMVVNVGMGKAQDDLPSNFKVRITFTGEGLKRDTRLFDVSVTRGQILIRKS
jgi:hypothetical protein